MKHNLFFKAEFLKLFAEEEIFSFEKHRSRMLVLNPDDENEVIEETEVEEEIFATVVEVRKRKKKRKKRSHKFPIQRRFDDYFFEEYAYQSAGEYHDHDFQVYPSRRVPKKVDPYKAPDPPLDHLLDHHGRIHDHYIEPIFEDRDYHHGYFATIFRDVSYYPRKPTIRNPRDDRFFPGNEPAGVLGLTPADIEFIRTRVNDVASYVQGPLPTDHIVIHLGRSPQKPRVLP